MYLGSVADHFLVTMPLNSDLVSRLFVSRAYLRSYYLRWESQVWSVGASWNGGVSHTIFRVIMTFNLTSDLISRIIMSEAYIIYYLR